MKICEDYGSYFIIKEKNNFYITYINNKMMLSVRIREPEYLEILNIKY